MSEKTSSGFFDRFSKKQIGTLAALTTTIAVALAVQLNRISSENVEIKNQLVKTSTDLVTSLKVQTAELEKSNALEEENKKTEAALRRALESVEEFANKYVATINQNDILNKKYIALNESYIAEIYERVKDIDTYKRNSYSTRPTESRISTIGFEIARKKALALKHVNKTVFYADFRTTEGSGVLLPDNLVALAAHQVHSDDFVVVFPLSAKKSIFTRASVVLVDKKHDVALAKIDDIKFIRRNKLLPAKRTASGYTSSNDEVSLIGFYGSNIHAAESKEIRFQDNLIVSGTTSSCKFVTKGMITLEGMSGGGGFNNVAEFRGIISSGGDGGSQFTPAAVVWSLVDIYKGRPAANEVNIPESCRIDPKQLVTGSQLKTAIWGSLLAEAKAKAITGSQQKPNRAPPRRVPTQTPAHPR